jgi:hypothetical protein
LRLAVEKLAKYFMRRFRTISNLETFQASVSTKRLGSSDSDREQLLSFSKHLRVRFPCICDRRWHWKGFNVDGDHNSIPLTSILEHDRPPTTSDPIVDSNTPSSFAKPNPLWDSQRLGEARAILSLENCFEKARWKKCPISRKGRRLLPRRSKTTPPKQQTQRGWKR